MDRALARVGRQGRHAQFKETLWIKGLRGLPTGFLFGRNQVEDCLDCRDGEQAPGGRALEGSEELRGEPVRVRGVFEAFHTESDSTLDGSEWEVESFRDLRVCQVVYERELDDFGLCVGELGDGACKALCLICLNREV